MRMAPLHGGTGEKDDRKSHVDRAAILDWVCWGQQQQPVTYNLCLPGRALL